MIRRHDFNSEWWGEDVGIVSDPAFFELAAPERMAAQQKFAWLEFVDTVSPPLRQALTRAGFFYIDTQIRFRLDMRNISLTPCGQELQVETAAESPFAIHAAELRPFEHERFYALPGATELKISSRYALWAADLVRDHSETCLRLLQNNDVQGWFLAQRETEGLRLTLAMLSSDTRVSGYDLYARAISHFAAMGLRLGFASFSANNSNVLNIYARMGARFLQPRECWMWVRPAG
ncbi:MAG: hypothetical protein ROO76_00365 [Terriglobia bacterium]|nr:hypothetical protein [Terriglobia bacterium]